MSASDSYEQWMAGDALRDGAYLIGSVDPEEQVRRALAVLDLCRARVGRVEAVESVIRIGAEPSRWREAHAAFDRVRGLTLAAERAGRRDAGSVLLYVAENVAKTIYNACRPDDPFDEDSPHWVSATVRDFVAAFRDEALGRSVWQALSGFPAEACGPAGVPGTVEQLRRRSQGMKGKRAVSGFVRWRTRACVATVAFGCIWSMTSGWVASVAAALGILSAVFAWMLLSAKPAAVAIEWDGSAGDGDDFGGDHGDAGGHCDGGDE